jgi:hypothetical protein
LTFYIGGGDGFLDRRLRQIGPKTRPFFDESHSKFGHTREKHRQNLGALMARIALHLWFLRAVANRDARVVVSGIEVLRAPAGVSPSRSF